MSSPVYRNIVSACIDRARSVKDISDRTGIPLASTYRQVNALCDLDVLVVERSAMTEDGKAYDLYRSRIQDAAMRLDRGGVHVEWHANAPLEDKLLHIWDQLRRSS